MNDPQKSDLVRRKEFQLSNDESENEESGEVPKLSPSNLLPDIKGFNIEKTRYQHYGHKSSMNAQSLEKIMNEEKSEHRFKTSLETTLELKSNPSKSPNPESLDPSLLKLVSRSRSDTNLTGKKKLEVSDSVEEIIHSGWPYSEETFSELLKFKTEQERTKQEELRNEYASTALQLLTLVRDLEINPELIPELFHNSIPDLKNNINRLSSNPVEALSSLSTKRRYSDMKSYSSNSDSNDPPQIELNSPVRSPAVLPGSVHRRGRSDESEQVNPSNIHSPNSSVAIPRSLQHSPSHIPQAGPPPGMYPVYYAPMTSLPPGHNPPPPPPPPPQAGESKSLGSPYQQKYQQVLFAPPKSNLNQPQPPPPPPPGQAFGPGGYYPPQQYYYVTTPPNRSSNQQSKYPVMTVPVPQFTETEESSHKKHKSGKNTSINFMISTPKNPPARKYNNPKEK